MQMLQRVLLVAAAIAFASGAGAATITFDEADVGLVHGSLVSTQYEGVTISAVDKRGKPKPAVAFDTDRSHTRDRDLEFGDGWKRGNLSDPPVPLGNVLIINENEKLCWTGVCSKPDDEAKGGSLIFEFDAPVLSLGFDLIDIEGGKKHKDSELGGSIIFTDSSTGVSVEIGLLTFLCGFELGDNSANRIPPFIASELGLSQFDIVELRLKGSGAIDNLVFEPVPEPTTVLMLGLGLAGLAARARARRR